MTSKEDWKAYLIADIRRRPLCRNGAALSASGLWLARKLRAVWPFVPSAMYVEAAAERYALRDELLDAVKRAGSLERRLRAKSV